ncbi:MULTISPECIES: DUF421 domain-containing protein [Sporolactobacillus]|uniref:YDFR protein n=3 Tax=Sporolactobacillus TaxID=2077 RepID=A0A4Y1ZGY7_9BACL|nr:MULTISPECIES: YetF domain-containing protein [Sporolactobacillus]KLI03457.1 hypothetical protein SINU_02690 [Sporolactobacillus inulinus CASD]UAK16284.1 DUF421 domain-containing protein [Sporolactobacillus terrae]GAY78201.1 YDFR protein [Sporolactobacillus inulinus]GEB77425.1 DUF421 domain-containing protein [Sporolactobacillus inulinus]
MNGFMRVIDFHPNWLWQAVVILLFGVLLIRVSGRKSISQMTIPQTVIMISIGTMLVQPVSGKSITLSFAIGVIFVATLFVIDQLQLKWDWAESLFSGHAKIIIKNGKLRTRRLRKMKMTVDHIEMQLRQNGVERLEDIEMATVEQSGQIACLLVQKKRPATKEDIAALQQDLAVIAKALRVQLPSQQKKKPQEAKLFTEIENHRKRSR